MHHDTGQSPFALHAAKLSGDHGAATRLKRIVLNLYNGTRWPILQNELAAYLANADKQHRAALLAMLDSYAQHGENDKDFHALGRSLALQAMRDEEWRLGYDDGQAGIAPVTQSDVSDDYRDGHAAGCQDRQQALADRGL